MAKQLCWEWLLGYGLLFSAIAASGCARPPDDTPVDRTSSALSLPERGASVSINFETDPSGAPLPRGTVLAEQYAAWGIHFENSFLIGDHATDFSPYFAAQQNMVCTHEAGVDPNNPGACFGGQPALGTPLIVDLDFDACEAGIVAFPPPGFLPTLPPLGTPTGQVTVDAYDSAGTLDSSYVAKSFATIGGCDSRGNCLFFNGTPAIAQLPLFGVSAGQLPPPGHHIRRLIISEVGMGALDGLAITRCAGFVARCGTAVSCAAPGQNVAPSVSINFGTEDPDGNSITFSQMPAGPFPIGVLTPVTLTASNGITTSTCQGSIFGRDCTPPTLTCPAPITVECTEGCTPITMPPAVAIDDLPGAVTGADGSTFCTGPGTFNYAYFATDLTGNASTCTTPVTVADTKPPEATVDESLFDIDAAFSPPDDELHTVTLAVCGVQIVDACQGSLPVEGNARITCVTSDEAASPQHGGGGHCSQGHHPPPPVAPPDIVLVDDTTVQLRDGRDNGGDGRVYTISFEVFDTAGNTSTPHTCKVHVAKHLGRPAIDSGPHQTVCRN